MLAAPLANSNTPDATGGQDDLPNSKWTIYPRPPYPKAVQPDAMTKRRLWFLYCVARFPTAQISELTGWPARAITKARGEWMIWRDEPFLHPRASDWQSLRAVVAYLLVEVPKTPGRRARLSEEELRRTLRYAIAEGRVSWKKVDEMPWPELVERS